MIDISEILIHWHAGRSQNQIAASLGVDRRTVRKYTAPAVAAGMRPGGPPVSEARWAELARGWFPELADARLRQVTWPAIAAHHEFITGQLEAGVTMATIHQRLRDEHGLAVSVASFRRYVAANLPEDARRSQVRVLRPCPAEPGEEAQIDYGQLGRWLDPATGKRLVIWAFAMVLACSRHMFVRPVIKLDQHAWTECHVAAFAFFGGVPARLVPDNLKTGVDKPDLYDPKINRSYAEMAAHYGALVDPARSRKPRDKARIERPMPYIRDSFWRGREWSSLGQMQAEAVRWCTEVAGQRSCRPLDGAAPAAVFGAVEAPALRPLPTAPFVLATWAKAKIGPDLHARVGKVLYSLPWRHIGKTADVRVTATMVQFFIGGDLVKTHPRKNWGKQTDFGDYPLRGIMRGSRRWRVTGGEWWAWWCWRRSGRCWAGTSRRPSGCGSGPIWAGRPGRSMRMPAGWRSTWRCASGRASTRPPRTGHMSRVFVRELTVAAEPAGRERGVDRLRARAGERHDPAAAGAGPAVLRLPDGGGAARVQPGRPGPLHARPAVRRPASAAWCRG